MSTARTITGVACAFGVRCGNLVTHAGGLDEHHGFPVFMGGDDKQRLTYLCPSHHRRQHSLLRALVQGATYDGLTTNFTADERHLAEYAIDQWKAAGSPPIVGWNCAAAS